MSYEEFVSGMELELKSLVSDNLLVSVQKTLKNNGYLRCGIRLSEKNINISPTIYLEEFYEKYQYGTDMHTLAEQIDQKIELTRNEFRILKTLMENRGKIVSRDTLMTRLWEDDCYVEENTLTVNVTRLRKKLEQAG